MKQRLSSKALVEQDETTKFTRMILYSVAFHLVFLVVAFVSPLLYGRPQPIQIVYSVDLVELNMSKSGLQKGDGFANPETIKSERSPLAELSPESEKIPKGGQPEPPVNKAKSGEEKVSAAPLPKISEPEKTSAAHKDGASKIKATKNTDDKASIHTKSTETEKKSPPVKEASQEMKKSVKPMRNQEKEVVKSEVTKPFAEGEVSLSGKPSPQTSETLTKNLPQQSSSNINKQGATLSGIQGIQGNRETGNEETGPAGQGLIASDNPSFRNVTYLDAIASKMYQNWNFNLWRIDTSQFQSLEVTINIIITRDGTIRNPTVQKSSGVPFLDRSALSAVYNANPLPPLPHEFKEEYLNVNLKFIPIPQEG